MNKFLNNMLFCLLFILCGSTKRTLADDHQITKGETCTTPDGKLGNCTALNSCKSLYQLLLTDGRNETTAAYLRKSQCDRLFENGMPIVCCSNSTAVVQNNTVPNMTNGTTENTTEVIEHYAECGKFDRKETRIVNTGRNVTLGDWPWMVALGYRRTRTSSVDFKCGATLISNKWVITSAHCVQNLGDFKLTTARLGDLDLNSTIKDDASPIDEPIDKIIPHPEYSKKPITNDIALLRLKNDVKFNKYIRPICLLSGSLYRNDSYYDRKRPFFIGWGAVEWQGASSTRLQETAVNIVNNTVCANIYDKVRTAKIDHKVLCAGEKSKDACQGDPGGSLLFPIADGKIFYLGGIMSFGYRCLNHSSPGVSSFTYIIMKIEKDAFML